MANTAIHKFSFVENQSPVLEKVAHILADGTRVAVITDNNLNSVPGAGGDGTGIAKAYVYTCPAGGTTWTQRASWNCGTNGHRPRLSSALDAAGNLHVAWLPDVVVPASDSSVQYRPVILGAGPTYTPGTQQQLAGQTAAGYRRAWLDIDVVGTGVGTAATPVVVVQKIKDTATRQMIAEVFVNTTGDTWVQHADLVYVSGDDPLTHTNIVTVSGNQAAHASNVNTFLLTANRVLRGSGTDLGDVFWICEANFNTGAKVSDQFITYPTSSLNAWNKGKANGIRRYRAFNTANDEWIIAGNTDNSPSWETFVYKVGYNRATNVVTDIIVPTWSNTLVRGTISGSAGAVPIPSKAGGLDQSINRLNWADVVWDGKSLIFFGHTVQYAVGKVVTVGANSVEFGAARPLNNLDLPSGALHSQMWGAQQRTPNGLNPEYFYFISTHLASSTGTPYEYRAYYKQIPSAPANVVPAGGSTVATDRPALSADHRYTEDWAQSDAEIEWQIASDAGFTTNVRTIQSNVFVTPHGTTTNTGATVRSTAEVDAINELYQGTWYARARTIEMWGVKGAWSAATAGFTVSHPPVAAPEFPLNGTQVGFTPNGGGNHELTFQWDFTDTSPSDVQTAYEIVVYERTEQGDNQILTSGKTASANPYGMIQIPSTHKDKYLVWKVRTWDSDDVAGAYSDLQTFYLLDKITVAITAPTAGQVLTSAMVNVTWTHSLSNARSQQYARVLAVRNDRNEVAFDTGWYQSNIGNAQIPTGFLRNDLSYTLTVAIRDNLGLEGVTTRQFSTDWPDPTAPPQPLKVSLIPYDKHGYVWVSQSMAGFDVDFIGYNLYRRTIGTSTWELIHTWTSSQGVQTYADFSAASNTEYEYLTTQLVARFGDLLESPLTSSVAVRVKPKSAAHWLVFSDDSTLRLHGVTGATMTDEYESETFHVQGFGRRREVGDRLGYTGTLNCQLRDKHLTGTPVTNYLKNPNFLGDQIITGGVVTGIPSWTLVHTEGGNNVSLSLEGTLDSMPSSALKARMLSTAAFGVGDSMILRQRIDNTYTSNLVTSGGVLSVWVAGPLDQGLYLYVQMRSAANALLNTVQVTLTDENTQAAEAMDRSADAGSLQAPSTEWRRYRLNVPAYTAQPVAYIECGIGWVRETGTTTETFTITGAQYQIGTTLTPLVEGNAPGAWFDGDPLYSTSYTTGHYTARQQRLALEATRARLDAVLLRNPFGDVYAVGVNDIGVTFVAGTETEMSDVTIPFVELGS